MKKKDIFHARHAKLLEILFSMGLPRAIKAHSDKKFVEAEQEYRRAYDQGQVNEIFFQNFPALLRQQGKVDESRRFFEEGLDAIHNIRVSLEIMPISFDMKSSVMP